MMKKGLFFTAASAVALSAVAVAPISADAASPNGVYDTAANKYYSVVQFQKMTSTEKASLLTKPSVYFVVGAKVIPASAALGSNADINRAAVDKANFTAANLDAIYAGTITAPGELKVESVSAINATQIEIVFNQKVDEDTATELDNYYIGLTKDVDSSFEDDLGNTGYSAELLEDGKTVIISANNVATHAIWADEYTGAQAIKTSATETVLENRTVYVQIKDIKTADGKLASAIEDSFVAKDTEGPKFASSSYPASEVTSNPTIIFSEPVVFTGLGANATDAQFYLNGTNVTAAVDYLDPTDTSVAGYSALTVDLSAVAADFELEEGNNTFEVVGLEDLAGNSTTPSRITTTIKVAEETAVAPKVVGINQLHDGAFLVSFDKAIAADTGTVTVKNNKNDGDDWEVTLNPAAGGNGAFHSRDANGNYRYIVEFDEDSDYTTDEVYQGANSVIRTVVVEDFQDTTATKTGAKHTKAYTFKKDNVAPTAVSAKVIDDAADQDIELAFTDAPFTGLTTTGTLAGLDDIILKVVEGGVTTTVAVAATSVTQPDPTKNIYTLDLDSTDTAVAGPQYGSEADLFDNNGKLKAGITITLPYGLVVDTDAADTPQYQAGYQFIGKTLNVQGGSAAVVPQTSQAGIAYNADLNAIEVKFVGEDIDSATVTNKANYTFDGTSVANIAGASIEYSVTAGTKLARIFLPDNSVVRDGNYNLTIKDVATKSGAKMLPTTVVVYNVEDNTQPLVTAAKVTSDNTIEVTFDETLDVTTGSAVANAQRNFKVIVGGATYNVSGVDAKNTRTLVLTTVDTFDYNKAVQVQFAPDASDDVFVTDVAGNKAATKTVNATKDVQ